eukprot:3694065-Rhodomonas_salina.1
MLIPSYTGNLVSYHLKRVMWALSLVNPVRPVLPEASSSRGQQLGTRDRDQYRVPGTGHRRAELTVEWDVACLYPG